MRILIVEDEPAIADTVIYALKSEGMQADWVTTGAAALSHIQQNVPDLVVLDIGLPDMRGFDVCRQIRATSILPQSSEAATVTNRIGCVDG